MNVEKVNTWREVDVGWHSPEKPQNLSQDKRQRSWYSHRIHGPV